MTVSGKNGRRDAGRIYEAEGLNFFGKNFGKKIESHDASITFQMDQGECTRLGSGSCGKS